MREHTTAQATEFVPEVVLRVAEDVTPLWELTGAPEPPFWAFPWAGGQGVARYVLDNPATVAGRRVFDLACGSGLVAIAAALAGAASVTAAEIDAYAAAAIRLNAACNRVAITVREDDATLSETAAADVVTAGDICYEQPMTERAVSWLRACAARGSLVLLGDPGRSYLPRTGLVEIARYEVPTSRELEDRDSRETIVYRVLPE